MKPTCELVEKYKDRWSWCSLCRAPIIHYSCCGVNSCSGGGCKDPRCNQENEEIGVLHKENLTPTIDQIKGARETQRRADTWWYKHNKKHIEEDPEWFQRIVDSCSKQGVPFMFPLLSDIEQCDSSWDPSGLSQIFDEC